MYVFANEIIKFDKNEVQEHSVSMLYLEINHHNEYWKANIIIIISINFVQCRQFFFSLSTYIHVYLAVGSSRRRVWQGSAGIAADVSDFPPRVGNVGLRHLLQVHVIRPPASERGVHQHSTVQ